jgi:hypothetical protein
MTVTQRREGETELDHLRRKEMAWGLWQGDALERMSQQDQTIDALKDRLRNVADCAQAAQMAVVRGLAELRPDDLARDVSGHINLMGAMGDPDYRRSADSCRHVDLRARKPRAGKAVSP